MGDTVGSPGVMVGASSEVEAAPSPMVMAVTTEAVEVATEEHPPTNEELLVGGRLFHFRKN